MEKAAIIVAPGFEKGEIFTIVDIIRRTNVHCDMFGFDNIVEGGHQITVQVNDVLNDKIKDYDIAILPGGYGGAHAMRDSYQVIEIL
ncbi:MAG: DJ-1/PfpI family protein [Erysipelotrichaceae bacterium]|nr:DJ-1/PfpI family protein [Erysipelotrichaceae bacterium]